MAGYTHTAITQAEDAVLLRLSDSTPVRYLRDEVNGWIIEALRTFASLTGMYQHTDSAVLPAGTIVADLPTLFPTDRGYTVLDQDLVKAIEYHTWEPPTPAAWSGTPMFTLADITQAIERTRNRFLRDTSCRLTRHSRTPAAPAVINAGDGSYSLDQTVVDVRRAVWYDANDGSTSRLWRSSENALRAGSPTWNLDPGVPRVHHFSELAPNILEFGPPPINSGWLDLITVDTGAALDPSVGVLLGVPDDLTWAIKWGALADLLGKDGPARDYARALFCERRYLIGVAAATNVQTIVDAKLGLVPAQFSTIDGIDQAITDWQTSTGTPETLAPIGLNLVGVYPVPVADIPLTCRMVRNVPIPTIAEPHLQVGREYLDTIYGYAVHLAMFKVGGQEFAATTQFAEALFNAAMDWNATLADASVFEDSKLAQRDGKDERIKQRGVRRVTGATVQ